MRRAVELFKVPKSQAHERNREHIGCAQSITACFKPRNKIVCCHHLQLTAASILRQGARGECTWNRPPALPWRFLASCRTGVNGNQCMSMQGSEL